MFTSILCPVDFSAHSERALGYALKLAALTGAHLNIMTAVDPFLDAATQAAGQHDALVQQTQQEVQELLRSIAATEPLRETPGILVITGKPADKILEQIKECGSDVVVMGTQGLEGTRRLVFGSTTERVLRESRVPVLAVPLPENAEGRG